MSEATIARWNAISMNREEQAKRSRTNSEDEGDSDDDISLVSRSPSPTATNQQQSGSRRSGTEWYDDHVKGATREVITFETKIKPTNVGFGLLMKMGWKEGEGLGVSGQGRADPIPFAVKYDTTGLGKTAKDLRIIETVVSQRRELDSERQIKETEEQRKAREALVAQKEAIKSEVNTTLKAFYCELCDKQYINVAQFDEHVRGYAHTHKLRFREMTANQRPKDVEKRKEKEKKREEKELRKLAAAHGVKMPSSSSVVEPAIPPVALSVEPGVKKGGWASVGGGTVKSSGWAKVGATSTTEPTAQPNIAPSAVVPPTNSGSGFKTGGWSKLSTSDTPAVSDAPAAKGGWATVSSTSTTTAETPVALGHPTSGWSKSTFAPSVSASSSQKSTWNDAPNPNRPPSPPPVSTNSNNHSSPRNQPPNAPYSSYDERDRASYDQRPSSFDAGNGRHERARDPYNDYPTELRRDYGARSHDAGARGYDEGARSYDDRSYERDGRHYDGRRDGPGGGYHNDPNSQSRDDRGGRGGYGNYQRGGYNGGGNSRGSNYRGQSRYGR